MKKMLLISLLLSFATQYPMKKALKKNSSMINRDLLVKTCQNKSWRIQLKSLILNSRLNPYYYFTSQMPSSKSKLPKFFIENHTNDKKIEPMFEEIMQELLSNETLNINKPIKLEIHSWKQDGSKAPRFYKKYPTIELDLSQVYDSSLSQDEQKEVFKFVIAHELVHIKRQKRNNILLASYVATGLIYPIFGLIYTLNRSETGKSINGGIISIGISVICALILDRLTDKKKDEKIADLDGLDLCKTNKGALVYFKSKKDLEELYPRARIDKTHPPTQERYEYCKNWKPKKK